MWSHCLRIASWELQFVAAISNFKKQNLLIKLRLKLKPSLLKHTLQIYNAVISNIVVVGTVLYCGVFDDLDHIAASFRVVD